VLVAGAAHGRVLVDPEPHVRRAREAQGRGGPRRVARGVEGRDLQTTGGTNSTLHRTTKRPNGSCLTTCT
jgi:hypothetical protein